MGTNYNLSDYVYYDETSPTFMRWTVNRGRRKKGQVVGYVSSSKERPRVVIKVDGIHYSGGFAVCLLHGLNVARNDSFYHIDNDMSNCCISNLEIVKWEHKCQHNAIVASRKWNEMFEYGNGELYWKVDRFAGQNLHLRVSKKGDKLINSINSMGYHTFTLEGDYISAHLTHRVIYELITGEDINNLHVDHIDGDPTNNLIENLRAVTVATNCKNMKMNTRNKSGITGVCFDKSGPSYKCYWRDINKQNKQKTFSISKYDGDEKAFKAACDYRAKMIEQLNLELGDNGYTERHGKKMEEK